jgi:hypothetical protein
VSRTLVVAFAVGMGTLLTGSVHAQSVVEVSATIVEPLAAEDVSWEVYAGSGAWQLRAQRLRPASGSRVLERAWLAESAQAGGEQQREWLRADREQPGVRPQQLLHGRSETPLVLPPMVRRDAPHSLVLTRIVAAHS